jgi:3'-phosphoadenosine 5'-phosphosulfate sulfotransferase (PAPS reductase)/FAD synthetase
MLDLCCMVDTEQKIKYVFFDTGLEYEATKEHLKYLEEKYNINIYIEKASKPIPTCCKQYGQPFISKYVSEFMSRLQRHNFKWEDESYDQLILRYPKCKSALQWWCNDKGSESHFNIHQNKWLKEFILENPPRFKISNKCCHFAKKKVAKDFKINNNIDLSLVGVRKAEGGARATAYKNCFTNNVDKEDIADEYRPIFWYKEETKRDYENQFNIIHSRCYSEYRLKRTGCAGCPYNRNFEFELKVIEEHEPKLFKAVNNIFGESYEYTRKYKEFVRIHNELERNKKNKETLDTVYSIED